MSVEESRGEATRRTAVVTGGSGSIGGAIARRLGAEYHRVIVVGRRKQALEAVTAAIGEHAAMVVADMMEPGWVDAVAEVAPEADVVVHCAAIYAPYGRLERSNEEDWHRVFEGGPTAAMRLVRQFVPGMKARGFGRIVLVGSLAATLGAHGQGAYAAAKGAMVALSRTIALEGGRHGVTANVVEPGIIDTPRVRGVVRPETLAALVGATPAGRLGTADEVAAAVAFLCSSDSSFVNGAVLPVTGGLGLGLPSSSK